MRKDGDYFIGERRRRGTLRLIVLPITVTVGALIVMFGPIILTGFARLVSVDWQTLGSIGEAYGGISALLSGAALIGVAISIGQQSRQVRLARVQASRTLHFELIRYVIDNPKGFARYWGANSAEHQGVAGNAYINQILNFVAFGLEQETLHPLEARSIIKEVLSGVDGRNYWQEKRAGWLEKVGHSRQGLGFISLIDSAYAEVDPPNEPAANAAVSATLPLRLAASALAAAAVATIIVGRRYRRPK